MKKEIWGVSEMIDYAKTCYKNVENAFKDISLRRYNKDAIAERIRKTLIKYNISKPVYEGSSGETHQQRDYAIPEDLAKFFVEEVMHDYFMKFKGIGDDSKIKEIRKQRMDAIEKDSQKDDEKLSRREIGIRKLRRIEEELDPGSEPEAYKRYMDEWRAEYPELAEEYDNDDDDLPEDFFKYHLPVVPEESFSIFTADTLIERMMIRSIFEFIYDFDEASYRRDLWERARRSYADEDIYSPGYSRLSRDLENPIGKYVFLKKRFEDKDKKKKEKDDKKQDKDKKKKDQDEEKKE